ncbi:MAG TPA: serine/threonine protein kinase [Myxococcales bacterium]|nr:serine/threonine protein kinase [Myxococcales bacterium]
MRFISNARRLTWSARAPRKTIRPPRLSRTETMGSVVSAWLFQPSGKVIQKGCAGIWIRRCFCAFTPSGKSNTTTNTIFNRRFTPWTLRAWAHRRKPTNPTTVVPSTTVAIMATMTTLEQSRKLPFTLSDRYECSEQIGFGGMGAVYLAKDTHLDREVAIKLLRDLSEEPRHQERNKKRFQREARALSKLRHPNTVQVIDFGLTDDGFPFIATELLKGESLQDLLDRESLLEPKRAVQIMSQICMSLSEAHSAGIIHRDLKPSNILLIDVVGSTDFVKVIDFGVARLSKEIATIIGLLTIEGTTLGTPDFMAPEQAQGMMPSNATDVYALGCLLYLLLTGRLPFIGATSMQVMISHVQESPPPLREIDPNLELPAGLESILFQTLEKDPAARPSHAGELLTLLTEKIGHASDQQTHKTHMVKSTGKRLNMGSTILVSAVESPDNSSLSTIPLWAWLLGAAVIAGVVITMI